jgi:hypothetical protein
MFYDFAPYFYNVPEADKKRTVDYDFDIERWFNNPSLKLVNCMQPTRYQSYFSEDKVQQIKNYIKNSHDLSFTIQRVYRDRNYVDFCPVIESIT